MSSLSLWAAVPHYVAAATNPKAALALLRRVEVLVGVSVDVSELEATPEPEKMFSWWSYRAADFRKSNRGLRLDHILVTPGLRDAAFRQGRAAARVHDTVREWHRPSDHAPVSADLVL